MINRVEFCQMKDPESFLALTGLLWFTRREKTAPEYLIYHPLYQLDQVCRSIHIYRHTVIVHRNTIHATVKSLIKDRSPILQKNNTICIAMFLARFILETNSGQKSLNQIIEGMDAGTPWRSGDDLAETAPISIRDLRGSKIKIWVSLRRLCKIASLLS